MYCLCGCAPLVAQKEGVTGAPLTFLIPHVTLSPALQSKRHVASCEWDGEEPNGAAVGWCRRIFMCLEGVLHTALLWLCSLWSLWRFECYLSWEPGVNEIDNPSALLNPPRKSANWKVLDPKLVLALVTGGSAATDGSMVCQMQMSFSALLGKL